MSVVYLDHNATTPIRPEVVDAMLPWLTTHFGNPSSGHGFGREAAEAVSAARAEVAELIGAAPEEIVFTSGGTESNNLAILGVAGATARRHAGTSVLEHPAVRAPLAALAEAGWEVTPLGVDPQGRVRPHEAATAVDSDTALLTVMLAHNETGVLQPVAELAALARAHGAVVHTDAAQAVGKVPVRVDALGVDLLTIAGHKLYAPKGVGALYVRRGTALRPVLHGADHEGGLRPGTENVAGVVALGAACRLAARDLDVEARRLAQLRDRLHEHLRHGVPGLALTGHPTERLPNTLHVRFPRTTGAAVLARAPSVAASTGSACHDGRVRPSPALLALGLSPDDARGAVRLSLGHGTTEGEVDRAAEALIRAWREETGG